MTSVARKSDAFALVEQQKLALKSAGKLGPV